MKEYYLSETFADYIFAILEKFSIKYNMSHFMFDDAGKSPD